MKNGKPLSKATGWSYHSEPSGEAIHFNHSMHGTISIKKNPRATKETHPYVALHNGASIGRFPSTDHAVQGVKNYIGSLKPTPNLTRMFNKSEKKSVSSLRKALKSPKVINKVVENNKFVADLQRGIKAELNQKNNEMKDFMKSRPDIENSPEFAKFKPFLRQRKLSDEDAKKTGKPFKWGIDHAKLAMSIAKGFFDKDPSKFRPVLTTGNSKCAPMGIALFDIPAVKTCPGADTCTDICYADAGQTRNFDKLARYSINFYASRKPEFPKEMDSLIKGLKTFKENKADTKDWSKLFRPHGYGDFYSDSYAKSWHEVMKNNPQTNFYAYTKSYAIPRIKDALFNSADTLPNFVVRQSVGSIGNRAVDPNRPICVIAEDDDSQIENGQKAGLVYCHGTDDSPASKKDNHVIMLRAHGASKGKHSLDKHLEGLPPALKSQLDSALRGQTQMPRYPGSPTATPAAPKAPEVKAPEAPKPIAKSLALQSNSDFIDLSDHFSQPDEMDNHISEKNKDLKSKFKRILLASRKHNPKPNLG